MIELWTVEIVEGWNEQVEYMTFYGALSAFDPFQSEPRIAHWHDGALSSEQFCMACDVAVAA